jgi:hypothetical protein
MLQCIQKLVLFRVFSRFGRIIPQEHDFMNIFISSRIAKVTIFGKFIAENFKVTAPVAIFINRASGRRELNSQLQPSTKKHP